MLLSNVLVQFPLNAWLTWGAFSYPVAYLVTDVCNRVAGPQLARRVAWVGFAIGLTSSALLAPVRIALASGVAIGGFFVCLGRTAAPAGLWPLAVSRTVSVAVFLVVAFSTRQTWKVPAAALPAAIACGGLDMIANGLYLAAVRQGQLSLVATLASLYPASTVLLARVVLGERLGRLQLVGVVAAVAAIVLIVANS